MTDITPYQSSSSVVRRSNRSTGRALARINQDTDVSLAIIESKAETQAAKAMAVSFVGKRAMHEVAMVSQLEQQLATVVPMATSRLQAIGDVVALSMAEVVAETAYRVNR